MGDSPADFAKQIRTLKVDLDELPKSAHRKAAGALTRTINRVDATARELAPRDRPWLATEGIRHDTRTMGRRVYTVPDESKSWPGAKTAGVDIGMLTEYGTSDTRPQPFLVPAFEAHAPAFLADMDRILADAVREIAK